MTGSTHTGIKPGIYRVKVNSKEYELLVESENISMFDVADGQLKRGKFAGFKSNLSIASGLTG